MISQMRNSILHSVHEVSPSVPVEHAQSGANSNFRIKYGSLLVTLAINCGVTSCALFPMETNSYSTGQKITYYSTDSYTGYRTTKDGRLGIVVLGRTSLSDVASFTIRFYNLTDNAIEMDIENVMANGQTLRASSSPGVVSPNGVVKIEFEPYRMTYYGAAVITVVCRVGEERYLERFVPRRIRTDAGFPRVANLHGGMLLWQQMGLPVLRANSLSE